MRSRVRPSSSDPRSAARSLGRAARMSLAATLVLAPAFGAGCAESSSNPPPAAPPAASAAPPPSASAAPVASASAAPGASASETAASQPAPQEPDDTSLELVEHHRHHHRGGFASFLAMSLDTLGVDPDHQAAVTKIQTALRAKLEPVRAADEAVANALADGIAANKIDKAKVDAAVARLATASAGAQAAADDALKQLHAVLTPPERAALVDKIDAHWQVWQEANESAEANDQPHEHGRLEHVAKELDLTPQQVEQIRTALRAPSTDTRAKIEPKEMDARLHAFADAFAGDAFDPKPLRAKEVQGIDGKVASAGAARMAHFLEAISPALTPEQRTKLAAEIREHAKEKLTSEPGT